MDFKAQQSKRVLSVEEEKCTLSGKKKHKKTTLRNILSTPYADYWPVVTAQDEAEIVDTLRKYLNQLISPKVSIPWGVLKTMPREERKAFRTAHAPPTSTTNRSHLVFGTNEVTKSLESNSVSSVLASSDADPKFLVKHVIAMCTLQKIPILLIPNLKNLLKEITGFPSLVVGFKANSDFVVIDKKIKELGEKYQPKVDPVTPSINQDEFDSKMCTTYKDTDDSETSCVYLYRKSKTERVFVPELSVKREAISTFSEMKTETANFISLGTDPDYVDTNKEVEKNVKVSYKSLLLKRVTCNKNRDKKKIEQLKLKLK